MKDQYKVVDTNIYLLDAAEALMSFAPKKSGVRNTVIIPYMVLEEIDKFKNEDYTSRGHQAKTFNAHLKRLIESSSGNIKEGIQIGENHFIKVEYKYDESLEKKLQSQYKNNNDNILLSVAQSLANEHPGEVEVVTNDNNMYIKANAIGLNVSDWKAARSIADYDEIYKGWRVVEARPEFIRSVLNTPGNGFATIEGEELGDLLLPNEYVFLYAKGEKPDMVEGLDFDIPDLKKLPENSSTYVFARHIVPRSENHNIQGLRPIKSDNLLNNGVMGVKPVNMEQLFALDALLDPNIDFVSLIGGAGTGKTLLSVATGLYQWSVSPEKKQAQHIYNPVLLSTPMVGLKGQKDPMGYLPGDKDSKMKEWLMPIYDNIKNILKPHIAIQFKLNTEVLKKNEIVDFLIEEGRLETQPLHLIRGRSFHDTFLVLDEAQNMDPFEVKTLLTRPAKGTKVVFTGDPGQIDKPGLTEITNGLCYSSERLKQESVSATIFLTQGERSELATLAAKLL